MAGWGSGTGRRERLGQDCETDEDSFGGLSHFLSPWLFPLQLPSTFGFPQNLFPWGLTWEVGLGLPQVLQGAYLLGSQDSKDEGLLPAAEANRSAILQADGSGTTSLSIPLGKSPAHFMVYFFWVLKLSSLSPRMQESVGKASVVLYIYC